jgi:hypothetical protein
MMNNKIQASPEAVAAGLMQPQTNPAVEPTFTDAGLFAMVGAFAFNAQIDDQTRLHSIQALTRVLAVAKDGGLDTSAENWLWVLFAEEVSPIDPGEKGQLLAVLCRLVSLSIGPGRMDSLIQDAGCTEGAS